MGLGVALAAIGAIGTGASIVSAKKSQKKAEKRFEANLQAARQKEAELIDDQIVSDEEAARRRAAASAIRTSSQGVLGNIPTQRRKLLSN